MGNQKRVQQSSFGSVGSVVHYLGSGKKAYRKGDGIHVVSVRFANTNAKRTDTGKVGGFSLDVLYLWEQSKLSL